MNLIRGFATVGGYTAASRLLGFLRDILIAQALGTGPVADAFFVAFRFPNLFRRLFGEGAFNAAFVPLFAGRLEREGQAAARAFAEEAMAAMTAGLLLLTVLAMAAMPWLMVVIAPGFADDPAQFDLAVQLTRIAFPYLLFMVLVALLGGVLNSLYKFAAAAAAPILLNVFFIVSLLLVLPFWTSNTGALLAWTVTAAGIGQFLFMAWAAAANGMALRFPRPRLTPGVRRLFRLMVPGLLSAGAMQLNLLVGTMIATLQAGAVSWLYYADRLYQLPLGLIGIGIGVVLLPDLSRKLRGGQEVAAMYALNRALELGLFLTLPATVALIVAPEPIVSVLFERGAFTAADSQATALALAAYAFGLPSFVLVKILQPPFYAREDTVTPLRFALISVAANVVLALGLFWAIGFLGLAIAASAASWLNTLLLAWRLHRLGFLTLDARSRLRLPRSLLTSALLGAALWAGARALAGWLDGAAGERFAALALLVAGGLVVYFGLAFPLKAIDRAELTSALKRKG
ncbi:putative peptidoglycan lipid II flippase [Tistlia consotensis]|uniref:Probable lipid II flippase MurJ n=1 Tax=Tistlia consotensis USBA 355 TaxID=560819 RepID=A0A1Y6CSB3_9PROT|nr:murein biosynthesis integral membrane protein MurJ [Tistlia consotensis]SMF74209.1 putative peptidoglycan lipid II flippase [Tistlia consotensis USBA 355]SNS10325.1 putative peptidoglycan lipid II flippase [Tistlia consotensis]